MSATTSPCEGRGVRPILTAPSLADITAAARAIRGKAIRTPLVRLNLPSHTGRQARDEPEIYLKLESLQPIQSFKVRPAANALASIKDKAALRRVGVCTASAGNFAQGLAWCCQEAGIQCTVVAPGHAPAAKLAEIRRRGATVVTVPFEEWWRVIETHQCPQAPGGAQFIHPGAEAAVLAGNATIALEILDDLPDVDCIVVPYGSGAVCTGVACGVRAAAGATSKGVRSACRVLACEPATAAPFAASKRRGVPTTFDEYTPSFVDGCGGKGVLREVWSLANQVVDGGLAVPVPAIANAVKLLAERNKVIVEGAGACPVAAAVGGMCGPARKIVCVVTGGGIDTSALVHILQDRGVPPPSTPTAAPAPSLHKAAASSASAGWWCAAGMVGGLCVGLALATLARRRT